MEVELETLTEERETVADVLEDVLHAAGCPIGIYVDARGIHIAPEDEPRLIDWVVRRSAA